MQPSEDPPRTRLSVAPGPIPSGGIGAYVSPRCRLGWHDECHGNTDTHVAGEPTPTERLRCACTVCEHPPAGGAS